MQEEEQNLQKTFESAYVEYLEPIYRYFFYRLNDRDRAKDLAQETFMRTWLYARDGGTIQAMRPFLYTTASNLFKNELRAKKPVSSLDTLMSETSFEVEAEETSAEERLEATLLMKKVDELPEKYREVLLLRYVDGLPPRDIAPLLDESVTAVSVRIHRALSKLRELYEPTP